MTTPSPVRLTVEFGGMAPLLRHQAVSTFLTPDKTKMFQRLADAVLILRVQGIITNADSDKALKRLGKKITSAALKESGT